MTQPIEYLRLTQEFLRSFDFKKAGIKRKPLCEWARKRRNPPLGLSEHEWGPMRRGEAVRANVVVAFVDYVGYLGLGSFSLTHIALPAEKPADNRRESSTKESLLTRGWLFLNSYLTNAFEIPEDAFCRDESDLALAAQMAAVSVGRSEEPDLSRDDARQRGEQIMHATVEEYRDILLTLWKGHPEAVMFSCLPGPGGAHERIGSSVIVPVTPTAYDRLRNGEIADDDLLEEDIADRSPFIYLNHLNDWHDKSFRKRRIEIEKYQFYTMAFQFAGMYPPLTLSVQPRILAIGGTAQNRKALEAYDYVPIGTKMPRTGIDLYEYSKPGRSKRGTAYLVAWAKYHAMRGAVLMTQAARHARDAQLKLEDQL